MGAENKNDGSKWFRALMRVIVSETIIMWILALVYVIFIFLLQGDMPSSNKVFSGVVIAFAGIAGIGIVAKTLFGYYLILPMLFALKWSWFKSLSRFKTGVVHFGIAGFCLLVTFSISVLLGDSLADDFLTDSWKITVGVGLAWLSTFLSIYVPGSTAKLLPSFMSVKWFFM